MLVIIVEGGIGVGKSTLLESFRKLGFPVVEESVPLPKLKQFLNYQAKHTGGEYDPELSCLDPLGFQLIMATERIMTQNLALDEERKTGSPLVFMERSLYSDQCFARVCIKDDSDLLKYNSYLRIALLPAAAKPDLTVYLRGSLEGNIERIKERGRPGEAWYLTSEGQEYCRRINDEHEKVFLFNRNILELYPDQEDWRDLDVTESIIGKIKSCLNIADDKR